MLIFILILLLLLQRQVGKIWEHSKKEVLNVGEREFIPQWIILQITNFFCRCLQLKLFLVISLNKEP